MIVNASVPASPKAGEKRVAEAMEDKLARESLLGTNRLR